MALDELNLKILREVGRGAHSRVFEIQVEAGSEPLVIRVEDWVPKSSDDPSSSAHRTLRVPAHPHLLPILDQGRLSDGRHWQIMRFVHTVNAHELVRSMGPNVALSLLIQAASGLSVLHQAGIVHADIKPENILVEKTESTDHWTTGKLFLADFDLARGTGADESIRAGLTGSLGYFAPEQVSSGSPPSHTTDVFALGLWLIWLIGGSHPFLADDPTGSLNRLANYSGPDPLGRTDIRFAGRFWSELISGMLEPDPATRIMDGLQCLKFIVDRSHLIPGMDERIGELLWNPMSLSSFERDVLECTIGLDGEEGPPDAYIVTDVHPRRVVEAGRYLSARLNTTIIEDMAALRQATGSDGLITLAGGSRFFAINLTSSPEDVSVTAVRSCLESWTLSPRESGRDVFPPVIFATEVNSQLLRSLGASGLDLRRDSVDARPRSRIPTLDSIRFSGIPISQAVADAAQDHGVSDPNAIEHVLQEAVRLKGIRNQQDGIGIAHELSDQLWRGLERQRLTESVRLSAHAEALAMLMSILPSGIPSRVFSGMSVSQSWGEGIDELVDAGVALVDSNRETVRLAGVPSTRGPASTIRVDLGEVARAMAADMDPAGKGVREVVEVWTGSLDKKVIRRVIRYCLSMFRQRAFANVIYVLRRPPDWPQDERITSLEKVWLWLIGETFLACGDELRALLAFDRVEQILVSNSDWGRAARLALRTGSLAFAVGRKADAVTSLTRAIDLAARAGSARGDRLSARARVELAYVQRADRPAEDLEAECRYLLQSSPKDRRTEACAYRVLADIEHRAGRVDSYRRYVGQTIRAIRPCSDSAAKARYFQSFASFHFANGNYARCRRLLEIIRRLPAHRIRNIDRAALLSGLGGLAYEEGRYIEALQQNLQLLTASRRELSRVRVTIASLNVALVLRDMGRFPAALSMIEQARREFDRVAMPHLSDPQLVEAEILLLLGDSQGATKQLEEWKLENWHAARDNRKAAWHVLNGQLAESQGQFEEAGHSFHQAEDLYRRLTMIDELTMARLQHLAVESKASDPDSHHARLLALREECEAQLGWRSKTRLRLALLESDQRGEWGDRMKELDMLGQDVSRSGFLLLEAPISVIKARWLMAAGWNTDAQDVIRMALDRVRLTAAEFRDARLRSAFLADPRRQALKHLAQAVASI